MTAHDTNLARGGLMRLFGFGRARDFDTESDTEADDTASGPVGDLRERRRRETLEDITRFLLTHRLAVTPFTLEAAYDVMTGSNPALATAVAQRVGKRLPVTLDWLEDTLEDQSGSGAQQIEVLAARLEQTIGEFASTTQSAKAVTSDYHIALEAHVGEIAALDSADGVIRKLAAMARDMLSRTREIERELTRSERETRALQKNLADARREAEMDHLTGLPNRRAFESMLKSEVAATRDSGEPLCVAFCDIDHFKRINDAHGHEAGDRILRTVAQSLATISNDRCHVARHGGEEFVILLRGKSMDLAWNLVDGARQTMAARKLINRVNDLPFGCITFSAGVADVHAYPSPREALRAADEALYLAKNEGRNRVTRADSPEVVDKLVARAAAQHAPVAPAL